MRNVEAFSFHGPWRRSSDVIQIGLVNNMPDAALRATELQFARLLKDAAGTMDVRLRLFHFPETERSELAMARMEGSYADAATLGDGGVDALIVTGAEPRAPDLRDEPYWGALVRLIDWAQSGTISTLFSCLAAHAAVLHLDGVRRRPLPAKLSGVFACQTVPHEEFLGLAEIAPVPHSRYNDLGESDLVASGYRILSRIAGGGVNMFTRKTESLFVFLQGHPEYDRESLGREFARDVGRFLSGERAIRPFLPENYFDATTQSALTALLADGRDPSQSSRYAQLVANVQPVLPWHTQAVRLFSFWLAQIAVEKSRRRARVSPAEVARLRSQA